MRDKKGLTIILSLILTMISSIALVYSLGLAKIVAAIVLIANIEYLIHQLFEYLRRLGLGNVFGNTDSQSEPSLEGKFIRDILIGIPFFLIGFIVIQTPIILFLALIYLIVTIRDLYKGKRKRREKLF